MPQSLVDQVPNHFRLAHPLDRYIPLLDASFKPEGYSPALVAAESLIALIWLARTAVRAAETAYSWRDYPVGSGVLAYNFSTPAMGLMVGANYKPLENGGPNLHAEQIALAKTRDRGLDHIMAIGVWGDASDTDANTSGAPTLRPCRRCAGMFAEIGEVRPETLILSTNQDASVCELYTAAELIAYYEDPRACGPINELPTYSLANGMDEAAYTNDILVPLLIPKVNGLFS